MTARNNIILTSFYNECIKIVMFDRYIEVEQLPAWVVEDNVMFQIVDSYSHCVYENVKKVKLPFQIKIPALTDGKYTLHIYYKSKTKRNFFIGLNTSNGFPFQIINNNVTTIIGKPFEGNKELFLRLNDEFVDSHNNSTIPYDQFIPQEIITLAHKIIRTSFSNYDKILAIHDWVAENIYYDYDSIEDNSYMLQKKDALSVLRKRRTVCSGYSELVRTLLRAVGVPAINMDCFALNAMIDGGWEKESNMSDAANHVITFAYADDRWIMLDTTWDSDNEYRHGEYQQKGGHGVSHQYFDCTLAFFSYTHRFIK